MPGRYKRTASPAASQNSLTPQGRRRFTCSSSLWTNEPTAEKWTPASATRVSTFLCVCLCFVCLLTSGIDHRFVFLFFFPAGSCTCGSSCSCSNCSCTKCKKSCCACCPSGCSKCASGCVCKEKTCDTSCCQ
uniref:Metallothionein n=1 Tax=Salarias fasciatus TaxID=181472 RepID=A0A672I6H0_SALFA